MAVPQLSFNAYHPLGPQPLPMNSFSSNFLPVANSPSTVPFNSSQGDYHRRAPLPSDHTMDHSRPAWAGMPPQAPQGMPQIRTVNVDVHAFVQTRDQLTGAFANLSSAIDHALKAYIDHTRVVLAGDAALDVTFLAQPIALMQQPQQMMAQMALQQNGGAPMAAIAPMLQSAPSDMPKLEDEGDGKKKRKKRAYKQRDPNAPKRPLTAYFRYLGEMRPIIQQEMNQHPENFEDAGKPGDISRIATERWNKLSHDEQQPYKAAYQAELKDYEIAIAAYKAAGGLVAEDVVPGISTAAAVVESEAPIIAAPVVAAEADSDSSSDSSDSDEEESPAKAAPPPVATPKKSAMKKGGRQSAAAAAAPQLSTVNDAASEQLQAESTKSSSPSKKRKGAADATEAEGSKKKRGRKTKADEVEPEPEPVPAPASSPPVEVGGKKKKDKKKKKSGD